MADREQRIKALTKALNSVSAENGSNTPDFVLGKFLADCLEAFDNAFAERSRWHFDRAFAERSTEAFTLHMHGRSWTASELHELTGIIVENNISLKELRTLLDQASCARWTSEA